MNKKPRLVRFSSPPSQSTRLPKPAPPAAVKPQRFWQKQPLLVVGVVAVVTFSLILTILAFHEPDKSAERTRDTPNEPLKPAPTTERVEDSPPNVASETQRKTVDNPVLDPNAPISRWTIAANAKAFLRSLANGDYFLDDEQIDSVTQSIGYVRHSPELFALFAQRKELWPMVSRARTEDLNPAYVIFFGAVEQQLNPTSNRCSAVVNSRFPQAKNLAIVFGKDANSYLLAVAAAGEAGALSRSPPLLVRMRKTIVDNRTERNVWFLHHAGAIDETLYRRVITFIALGTISQNPKLFGIDEEPLVF